MRPLFILPVYQVAIQLLLTSTTTTIDNTDYRLYQVMDKHRESRGQTTIQRHLHNIFAIFFSIYLQGKVSIMFPALTY